MTNLDDDEIVVVGALLPRILAVQALDRFNVAMTWDRVESTRDPEVVDLAPAIYRYKVYASLRENPDLFQTVRVVAHGAALGWGEDERLDMGASMVADLASEVMTAEDFASFMERHEYNLEQAAAVLGISRRMAAYYRKERKVPRSVALACRYLDLKRTLRSDRSTGDISGPQPRVRV